MSTKCAGTAQLDACEYSNYCVRSYVWLYVCMSSHLCITEFPTIGAALANALDRLSGCSGIRMWVPVDRHSSCFGSDAHKPFVEAIIAWCRMQ